MPTKLPLRALMLFAATFFCGRVLAIPGVTILDNSANTANSSNYVNPNKWAQLFTMPNNGFTFTLFSCKLYGVSALVSANATAQVTLWTDASGVPGTQIAFLGVTNLTATTVNPTFTATNTIALLPGQSYFVQVETLSNFWAFSATTNTAANGLATLGNLIVDDSPWQAVNGAMLLTLGGSPTQTQLFSPAKQNGNFTFDMRATSGSNYTVQVSTDLATWTTFTSFTGSGLNLQFSVPITNHATFFRVH